MPYRIVWAAEAIGNLRDIRAYVGQFAPLAAQRLAARLIQASQSLAELPERGRNIGEGLRELTIIAPYIVRYAVFDDEVVILRIRHGAQAD